MAVQRASLVFLFRDFGDEKPFDEALVLLGVQRADEVDLIVLPNRDDDRGAASTK